MTLSEFIKNILKVVKKKHIDVMVEKADEIIIGKRTLADCRGTEKPVLLKEKICVQIKATRQVQRVNQLQQEQGITSADIININQSITQIQQELARQTHFRGYYLLNADIVNLPASSTGDFAFSAESGTVWMYESEWYDSGQLVPDQVTPASDKLPIINGTAAAGNSTSYSRGDHVHPQQLTYDGNVTATKFIMTGGTNQQILLANGDTTTLDNKLSRTYNSSGGGWIRLCVFPAGASVGSPFIEFKVYSQYDAVQTIRLVPYYTVNGINTVQGVFTAPTRISASYTIDSGVNQLFHTHTGSSISAIYSAYVRIESTNSLTIVVSDQSTYYTNRVTEILTQDVVTSVAQCKIFYK
ncbi:MAG: hypothetical protein EZS28_038900 [Streblomastix strix]|uniref:Uncharacterized protein n=1 Tax=Streblomastix strix TaxID=222440 RepID=A0A5J4U5T9_9EUKA|nr:MAG: hypothetical protein EZS28_038900 [Streblomastix strix]